ncbi:MAG: hypothetical protein ABIS18_12095 [Actinomycetota bacterium]
MSQPLTSPSEHVARYWVAAYTLGIPPCVRDARRAEVESDMWEQRNDIASESTGGVLARVFGGVLADIAWAIDVRHNQERTLEMRAFDGYRKTEKVLIVGIAVLAALFISTALGLRVPVSILISAVAAIGLAGMMRLVLPPKAASRRLLATFATSVAVIVGIGAYVFSLEHWGGLAFILNVIGTLAMVVALGSLIMLVAGLIRGRHPTLS